MKKLFILLIISQTCMLHAGMPFWELEKILFGQPQNIPAAGTTGNQIAANTQLPVITTSKTSQIREPGSIIKTITVCISGLLGVYTVAKIINNNARLRSLKRRAA